MGGGVCGEAGVSVWVAAPWRCPSLVLCAEAGVARSLRAETRIATRPIFAEDALPRGPAGAGLKAP